MLCRKRLAMEQEDIDFRVALAKRLVKDRSETIEVRLYQETEKEISRYCSQ